MGVLWLCLDGIGHPADSPAGSCWEQDLPALWPLIQQGQAIDATLGVEGLPQSGTGQTSLMTGLNGAKHMGRHYGPLPGPTLKALLKSHSTAVRLREAGGTVKLLNFYPPAYFDPGRKYGAIVQSVLDAGERLNPAGFPSIRPTLGMGYEPPFASTLPASVLEDWGKQAARACQEADLVMLDLWFSDFIGHAQDHAAAFEYLARLDLLVQGALAEGVPLMVTSDHGNMEDTRIKTHTFARVPFVAHGLAAQPVTDIAGAGAEIQRLLGLTGSQ